MIDENNQKQKFHNSKLAVNRRASDRISNTFLILYKIITYQPIFFNFNFKPIFRLFSHVESPLHFLYHHFGNTRIKYIKIPDIEYFTQLFCSILLSGKVKSHKTRETLPGYILLFTLFSVHWFICLFLVFATNLKNYQFITTCYNKLIT